MPDGVDDASLVAMPMRSRGLKSGVVSKTQCVQDVVDNAGKSLQQKEACNDCEERRLSEGGVLSLKSEGRLPEDAVWVEVKNGQSGHACAWTRAEADAIPCGADVTVLLPTDASQLRRGHPSHASQLRRGHPRTGEPRTILHFTMAYLRVARRRGHVSSLEFRQARDQCRELQGLLNRALSDALAWPSYPLSPPLLTEVNNNMGCGQGLAVARGSAGPGGAWR